MLAESAFLGALEWWRTAPYGRRIVNAFGFDQSPPRPNVDYSREPGDFAIGRQPRWLPSPPIPPPPLAQPSRLSNASC
jgi:hypothetical protein